MFQLCLPNVRLIFLLIISIVFLSNQRDNGRGGETRGEENRRRTNESLESFVHQEMNRRVRPRRVIDARGRITHGERDLNQELEVARQEMEERAMLRRYARGRCAGRR